MRMLLDLNTGTVVQASDKARTFNRYKSSRGGTPEQTDLDELVDLENKITEQDEDEAREYLEGKLKKKPKKEKKGGDNADDNDSEEGTEDEDSSEDADTDTDEDSGDDDDDFGDEDF